MVGRPSLAWLLHQPQVTSVILGAKRPDQLADNIKSTELTLSTDELVEIGRVSELPPEYPGWMLAMQGQYRRSLVEQSQAARR